MAGPGAAGPAALAAATRAWAALRRPDPVELAACARAGVPELPFLAPALRRLLAELPAPADGLSGTERCALQAIEAGAATPAAAFLAAQDLEEAPFLGDAWFFRALAGLGHGPNRLVETQDGAELSVPPPLGDGPSFAGQPLRLTPAGRPGPRPAGRPRRAAGHRPLARRHPPHPRRHLALGPRHRAAHPAGLSAPPPGAGEFRGRQPGRRRAGAD